MKIIINQTFCQERDFYANENIKLINCKFEGPEDGESAFKECTNLTIYGNAGSYAEEYAKQNNINFIDQ